MDPSPNTVQLIPAAPAHLPLLSNLLQFYVYDFSEIIPLEMDADGRFAYPDLPRYFSEASHFPFLATAGGKWAGLVFTRKIKSDPCEDLVCDMAEFFVLRSFRRRGIGTALAHAVFARSPGAWQVRVMSSNKVAERFWRRAIESFTGSSPITDHAMVNGTPWLIFRFESRG